MEFSIIDESLEMAEEEHEDLELIVEIEFFGTESEPEVVEHDGMIPEHYVFDQKYFVKESEQPEDQDKEDLAEMLQTRIP